MISGVKWSMSACRDGVWSCSAVQPGAQVLRSPWSMKMRGLSAAVRFGVGHLGLLHHGLGGGRWCADGGRAGRQCGRTARGCL